MPGTHTCAFSADGRCLVTFGITEIKFVEQRGWAPVSGGFSPVQLLSASSGKILRQFDCADGEPVCVAISPDGATLAVAFIVGGEDRLSSPPYHKGPTQVRLISVETGREEVIMHFNGSIAGLFFSPNGTTLVAGAGHNPSGNKMFFFSIREGRKVEQRMWRDPASPLRHHEAQYGTSLAVASCGQPPYLFTPDSTKIVTGLNGGRPALVSIATGEVVQDWGFLGERDAIQAALSPDGKIVAVTSESNSGTARVYATATGEKLGEAAIKSCHEAVDISPDGSLLLAGSDIFSLSTFEKLATMESVWEWGKQERPGAPYFGFTGPAGFIADGSAVAYTHLTPGSCCLVNVPDGTMRWCWLKGQLVKGADDEETAA